MWPAIRYFCPSGVLLRRVKPSKRSLCISNREAKASIKRSRRQDTARTSRFYRQQDRDDLPAMRAYLEKEGIKAVLIPKAGQTAFASIVTDMSGKNNVTVYQGVRLTPGGHCIV